MCMYDGDECATVHERRKDECAFLSRMNDFERATVLCLYRNIKSSMCIVQCALCIVHL